MSVLIVSLLLRSGNVVWVMQQQPKRTRKGKIKQIKQTPRLAGLIHTREEKQKVIALPKITPDSNDG